MLLMICKSSSKKLQEHPSNSKMPTSHEGHLQSGKLCDLPQLNEDGAAAASLQGLRDSARQLQPDQYRSAYSIDAKD